MTRLITEDIADIHSGMRRYESIFMGQTGRNLKQIAMQASAMAYIRSASVVKGIRVAVVPVTSGLGIIGQFSETVADIMRFYGIDAEVSPLSDVAGLQWAYTNHKDMIFMADDDIFTAFGTSYNGISDNGEATGRGFAEALASAAAHNNIMTRRVLVLGAGPVGCAACRHLKRAGYLPELYDLDLKKSTEAGKAMPGIKILKKKPVMKKYDLIFDATTSGAFITEEDVTENTIIAAPGMPFGATKEAAEIAKVIHNPLELGVLTMFYDCLSKMEKSRAEMASEGQGIIHYKAG